MVLALWVLYHVPDLDRGLAEVRRVLRPGGKLVAVTNGDEHVADLRREGGGSAVVTTFSSENGEASLRRHFAPSSAGRRDPGGLPGPRDGAGLPATRRDDVAWSLPEDGWPREYAGHVTVFGVLAMPAVVTRHG